MKESTELDAAPQSDKLGATVSSVLGLSPKYCLVLLTRLVL